MITEFIEPIPNYRVELDILRAEYESVKHLLSDRKRPNSPVLIQRALGLITGNEYHEALSSLPYTKEVVTYLKTQYRFNTVTYRSIMPDTCYRWHTDFSQVCLHIPIITNLGCRFVYEDKSFHMPADGTVYVVNNEKYHSFMNGGDEPRVHITIENHGTRPNR